GGRAVRGAAGVAIVAAARDPVVGREPARLVVAAITIVLVGVIGVRAALRTIVVVVAVRPPILVALGPVDIGLAQIAALLADFAAIAGPQRVALLLLPL